MNSILVDFGTVLIEVILTWYLFSNTLRTGGESARKTILYYVLYGLLLAFVSFWPASWIPLRLLILFLSSLIGNHLTYHPKGLKNFYITALLYCSIILADVLGGGILSLWGVQVHLNLSGIELLAYHSTAKLLHLFLLYCLVTFLNRNRYHVPLRYHAVPLILCQIGSAYACYQNFFSLMRGSSSTAVTIEVLCLLYINVIICVYVERLKETYFLREQTQIAEQKLHFQQAYYQDVIERQEETRALWHDIKKYLLAMESLAQNGEHTELQAAYEEIHGKFDYLERTVDVENPVVNGILSYAVEQARGEGIALSMDVWVDKDLQISPADLYVIIGNTVDNAVEACSQLPKEERKIHLILRQMNHMLLYEISNPFNSSGTKKPGQIHGYGLKNVERCVKNNNGKMNILQENMLFTVSIRLTV